MYLISVVAMFLLILPILWIIFSEKPGTLIDTIKMEKVQLAIVTTFVSATITALVSLIFGIGLGYILSRKNFVGKKIISTFIDLPLALPHSVAGIALLSIFGRYGLVGQLFPTEYGSIFTRSLLGIIIAQLFVSAPLVIQSAKETFDLIDSELETLSHILGADSFTTFTKVTFPQTRSSIFASGILCWARAASEFGAVVFMAYFPLTAPVIVFDLFSSQGLSAARSVAVLIIIISTITFLLVKWSSSVLLREEK
ncbi:MAG: ABC transporter permease subunit [Candidatus Heimdallarchaeaceae archaeon]